MLKRRLVAGYSSLAVASFLACTSVHAAPVVSFATSSYHVGDTVTVIVSDLNPADGSDLGNGVEYAADFQLTYDKLTLAYIGSTALQSLDIFTAPDLHAVPTPDADPAGVYRAQIAQVSAPLVAGALFSIDFQALQASTSSPVQLSIPTGGAYGALSQSAGSPPLVPVTNAQTTITSAGGNGSAVPEPSSAGLLLAAIAAGGLALRRRSVQARH